MDIVEEIQKIEQFIEIYAEAYDPEDKMVLKQTIQASIKRIRGQLTLLPDDLKKQVEIQMQEFEEILNY